MSRRPAVAETGRVKQMDFALLGSILPDHRERMKLLKE